MDQVNFLEPSNTGLPEFKIANLFEDIPILKLVQGVALKIEEDDPDLKKEKNVRLKKIVDEKFKRKNRNLSFISDFLRTNNLSGLNSKFYNIEFRPLLFYKFICFANIAVSTNINFIFKN